LTSALKICPVCSTEYPANERFCPRDGSALRAQGGSSTDLVGTVIAERYHIIKKLGEGGMGQVYLAEHVKMGRKSAVKVMNPGMVENVDAVSRFNREAANASKINHPNVAGIYDFGETPEGLIYLAMEFVEGEPLTDIIKAHGALPPMRASEIARQTAEGLAVAHDMGIVHRDLKPDNIMVAKGRGGADLVKVVDFGIAKAAASDNQKVTKTGMVVGTPEYMSPEQLSGDPLDARSDIYSLGLVTFAMLTGKLPFPSESMQETMIMRLTDKPKSLSDMKPDMHWPGDVQAVMDKVLERDVTLRYRTASEFAHDLVQAIDRMPATSIHSMPTAASPAMHAESLGSSAKTTRISAVPKTRVAGKADVAGVTHAELAAADKSGRKKSNMPMLAGVGGAIALAAVAFVVMKPTDKAAGKDTTSRLPAATQDAAVIPTGSLTDAATSPDTKRSVVDVAGVLKQLDDTVTFDTTAATAGRIVQRLKTLKPSLVNKEDIVHAAVIEAQAEGNRNNTTRMCEVLRSVAIRAKDTEYGRTVANMVSSCPSSE
jgi:eukaryotic-like serine/threonine-protein kinase